MVDKICSLKCMPTQQSRSFIVDSSPLFYLGIASGQHRNCQDPAIPPLKTHEDCHQLSIAIKYHLQNELMSLVTSQVVYPDQVTKTSQKTGPFS